jgi:hypothetical protein
MTKDNFQKVWVAVRIQRGFVADVRAYRDPAAARRTERSWRQRMNPDYDETALTAVTVNPSRCPARID